MYPTSGLVLDVHDDFQGEVLRSIYPSMENIPESVKVAHVLSIDERESLPDEAFALVLLNDGEKIRKYACIDAGHTTLSAEFFAKTAHKLPIEAQKIAAHNIEAACQMFDVEPSEGFKKIAVGLGTMINALPAMSAVASVPGQIKQNREEQQVLGQGGHVVTGDERAQLRQMMGKTAEVTGTTDMPQSASPPPKKVESGQTVVEKTADPEDPEEKAAEAMHRLVAGGHSPDAEPTTNENVRHGEQPARNPQMRAPHVNVSGKSAPIVMKEKKAERYALPSEERYPLDSYAHVVRAADYFEKYAAQFVPEDRREFAVNLVKRASELGVKIGEEARQYGAGGWAPEEKLAVGYSTRRQLSGDIAGLAQTLDSLYEKRAELDPELFAATLSELDKVAGWDSQYDCGIPDPFASTFGEKIAEEWSAVIGNDYVNEEQLTRFAKSSNAAVKKIFNDDLAKKFQKDPVKTFESLPYAQKKVLIRMASDNSAMGISPLG